MNLDVLAGFLPCDEVKKQIAGLRKRAKTLGNAELATIAKYAARDGPVRAFREAMTRKPAKPAGSGQQKYYCRMTDKIEKLLSNIS